MIHDRSARARLLALLASLAAAPATASELSYTFMDFRVLDTKVNLTGVQNPVPEQSVRVTTRSGDGIAVAGAVAAGRRFYLHGSYRSSIVDVDGVVQSPFATAEVSGNFDLVQSTLGVGYQKELRENFDIVAEIALETTEYDFGSFAGESFDMDDSGIGARAGFRWNPTRPIEVFAGARFSPVGRAQLSTKRFESDTVLDLGLRWYFFQDLALGFDYEAGDVDTFTISMRFSFGNLQW